MTLIEREREQYRKINGWDATLEPCPFCGSAAEMWEYSPHDGCHQKVVMCNKAGDESKGIDECPMYMPSDGFCAATKNQAREIWNTRHTGSQSPAVVDTDVLRNSIVEILKETVCNKKPWWVLKQLQDALNTQRVNPAILEKVEIFRLEWDQPRGVVLVWDSEPYGWKNELRNPESERPGALAIDADSNQWEAQGGDESSGAERWVLCCHKTSAQEDDPSDQH